MARYQKISSSIQSSVRITWRRSRLLRFSIIAAACLLLPYMVLLLLVRLMPFDDSRLRNLDVSSIITDRNGNFLRAYLSLDERWRLPAELETVAPSRAEATIATEDKRFYSHNGIDWRAVARAVVANLKSARVVSGASTITMQVAGFAIDSRERTLWRKLQQAFLALQIDHHWTKQEIMECYLTHASYGGNICGVEAAARRYFNKTAKHLSAGESALLAGLPQSPERLRPDKHKRRALKRREYVLSRMEETGRLTRAEVRRIKRLDLVVGLHDVPNLAPHFCDEVFSQYPGASHLQTTLDLTIQRQAERMLVQAVDANRPAGVSNGAVVVLKNQTAEVLALAGSADYWNKFNDGQVNGALGFRSPGSILKPLIFASAMDAGVLVPDETLFDVPVTYAGYSPENYDKQFRGPVPAPKALAWSLNIPAIDVLQRLGVPVFRDKLASVELPVRINRHGDAGLSLAMGTCSVRLLDMVRAYASLATDGVISEPVWLKGASSHAIGKRWISPEAAGLVLSALADETIRVPEEVDAGLTGLTGVAWKTGTSNGFRDAWTIAVTKDYTIGVWIGNMDGRPSRALVGSKAAAPTALRLAEAITGSSNEHWPRVGETVVRQAACRVTGREAGPYCPEVADARFIAGASAPPCKVHQLAEVDAVSGYCLCTRCSRGLSTSSTVCAVFPAPAATWLRVNAHPWADSIKAAHNPECQVAMQGEPPAIVTPAPGAEIVVLEELPEDQQKIALSARTADPGEKLYWFLNGSLAGIAPAYDTVRISPRPGRHKVICTDGQGRSSESWFIVEASGTLRKAEEWSRLSDSN